MTEAVRIRVVGLVQGVGFRAATHHAARQIGVRGWVRNLSDGSVEAFAEGEAAAVTAFADWCRHGPAWARVDEFQSRPAEPEGHSEFAIR
jgi:acylphosphatase